MTNPLITGGSMRKILWIVPVMLFCGCTYVADQTIPEFEDSNASLIKKSVESISLVEYIGKYIMDGDKIVFVSMESDKTNDHAIPAMIEDVMLAKLLDEGYDVLERDDNLLYRLFSEAGESFTYHERYKKSSFGKESGISTSNMGSGYLYSSSVGSNYSEGWEKEHFDTNTLATTLESADKIIGYRIIDSGIIYEEYCKESKCDSLQRHANTLLHLRAIDAKTSQLLGVEELKGECEDKIHVDDKGIYEDYSLAYYRYGYPVVYGTSKEPGKILMSNKKQASSNVSSVLGAIIAVIGVGAIAIALGTN